MQIVGQYTAPVTGQGRAPAPALRDAVTIGDALEATALSAGDKPVDQSDAAAIQATEMRATGTNEISPGGVGATAQSAATRNVRAMRDEDKTKLSDVLEVIIDHFLIDSPFYGVDNSSCTFVQVGSFFFIMQN